MIYMVAHLLIKFGINNYIELIYNKIKEMVVLLVKRLVNKCCYIYSITVIRKSLRRFNFMSDQLSNDVTKIVDDIFKQKEESEMIKETEKALTKSADTINELSESLEAKDQELADSVAEISGLNETILTLEAKIKELELAKTTLETEKTGLENEKADIIRRAEEAESKIDKMEKDKLAETRFSELKGSGIAATNDKVIEDQTSKIREMSDEDFISYKDELVAIREAIVAELKASEHTADSIIDQGANATGNEEDEKEGSEEDEKDAADSEVAINMMQSVAAALNMEVVPNKDLVAKYKELGSQMAENIKAQKGNK